MVKTIRTLIITSALLILASCSSTSETKSSSSESSTSSIAHTQTKTTTGYFYRTGGNVLFCGGKKLSPHLSKNALTAYFKNGIKISEGSQINVNNDLFVYVVKPTPKIKGDFSKVTVTYTSSNVENAITHAPLVDLTDATGIPSIKIKKYAIVN